MERTTEWLRELLTARSVLAVFGLQLLLFVVSMLRDVPSSFDGGALESMVFLSIVHARLVNAVIDYLLFSPSYVGDLDLLLGFLALPVVYYLTAVVVTVLGRAAYRLRRTRLAR
jgi:hypothetical protein